LRRRADEVLGAVEAREQLSRVPSRLLRIGRECYVTKPSPKQQLQPNDLANGQVTYTGCGIPRKVSVKACQGEDATVVVTVVQGKVWLSISPLFTWEAIMEPGKVDEVMAVLEVAREEARRMVRVNGRWVVDGGRVRAREITTENVTSGKKAMDTKKFR
jgi:hypothetical protein